MGTIEIARLKDYDYYAKNLLYIQAGDGLIQFDYDKRFVQRMVNEEWKKIEAQGLPVMLIILKARRHGVSTYVQSRMFHGCHMRSHMQAITIAADDEGCEYVHGMSQIFYEYLPPQLQPKTKFKSKERLTFDYSKTELNRHGGINLGLKSTMKTVSCTNRAGLGTGNHFIHFSEYAMYRDAESVRKAVVPTHFQSQGTFCVIESTANGMVGAGEAFYDEWTRACEGKSVFKPLFYSWLMHEDYRRPRLGGIAQKEKERIIDTITDEENELLSFHSATYEQLNWRREQIKFLGVYGGDEKSGLENFHEQYPSTPQEAFIVSGKNVFDRTVLQEYKRNCQTPLYKASFKGDSVVRDTDGDMLVWEDPIPGETYVIGIDPCCGEPGASDFACMEVYRVLDRSKGDKVAVQAAEWHGKEDSRVVGLYASILGKWYNMALVAPEVFSYGHAVLQALIDLDYPYIIRRQVMDSMNKMSADKLGWATTPTSKPHMLTTSRFIINNNLVVIRSEHLVNEMIIFVRDEKNKGANAYGRGKDDRVMAFMITICSIEQEYAGQNIQSVGIIHPNSEIPKVKKDKLTYDDFWDRHPSGKAKGKHWLEL